MTQVVSLKVRNFRGIKSFDLSIPYQQKVVCLIGRGDSGKTTILDAIAAVLSPRWNLSFYDTDFYNCNVTEPIEITVKLVHFPEVLLADHKYGLHAEGYLVDEVDPESEIPSLSIKLTVNGELEPRWVVTTVRENEDIEISASNRASLNCFMISDYIDQHFSWNKGAPLYSLQKHLQTNHGHDENIIIAALREAKQRIDDADFGKLEQATKLIEQQAKIMGLSLQGAGTTLDARDLSIKDGRVSLHEGTVPFRSKGKGTKRLASLAIQSALAANAPNKGIVLIDELEQGLEPDRIKHLVRHLKEEDLGQVFLTTHSRDAVQELGSAPIKHLSKSPSTDELIETSFDGDDENLLKAVRACPEAFFAKQVIVCEGATEVGICRALDAWRQVERKPPMAFLDCAYIDGTGNELASRVTEIHEIGITTALLCDTDDDRVNAQKNDWVEMGISVFDCDDQLCVEQQVFNDLPWPAVLELVDYVLAVHKKGDVDALNSSIAAKCPQAEPLEENWRETDTRAVRKAIAAASIVKKREWFKSVGHGEKLGEVIFRHIGGIEENAKLKKTLLGLSGWIDGGE
ncbi:DNA replication and repair protein RecF [Pseudovibrio sp. Ad5]|uniref:ATP-dependent nuclease n=1 Tax=Pseudovibrio sp. Ad5 TaxID=989436 RepID=UPI0007AEA001|nr:ATP-binding protein [Pseudovibrio sp. Ad5]KZK93367.1 DNA replication and repair protein RecF [Pseudovibrio sp. Ad5]